MNAVLALLLAFVLTLVVSLPNDWARRRATVAVTSVTTVINVAGIALVVVICLKTGFVNDVVSVVAMIVGIAVAGVLGNAIATRIWGRAGASS